jgi:hypothetical protein
MIEVLFQRKLLTIQTNLHSVLESVPREIALKILTAHHAAIVVFPQNWAQSTKLRHRVSCAILTLFT